MISRDIPPRMSLRGHDIAAEDVLVEDVPAQDDLIEDMMSCPGVDIVYLTGIKSAVHAVNNLPMKRRVRELCHS